MKSLILACNQQIDALMTALYDTEKSTRVSCTFMHTCVACMCMICARSALVTFGAMDIREEVYYAGKCLFFAIGLYMDQ